MAVKFVVALFESTGIAEDACNRLRTEGVPDADISLLQLRETAPLPAVVQPAIEALSVDPLVVGDVRHSFAPFIRNGATAVFVRTHSEAEIDGAVDTVRQYSPLRIRVATTGEGAPIGHDLL
jgi:phosphoglycolate phosphatase-like HAD superfamily hydrolase